VDEKELKPDDKIDTQLLREEETQSQRFTTPAQPGHDSSGVATKPARKIQVVSNPASKGLDARVLWEQIVEDGLQHDLITKATIEIQPTHDVPDVQT
jgi:hypothetical protein